MKSKSILIKVYIFFSLLFYIYLIHPNQDFPLPPHDSIQSTEPADSETPMRRAYFTNYTREEVLGHYEKQFETLKYYKLSLPVYRLNYPPEESQVIIRDQTRSTFLEEIVLPFRESLFINGFEPTNPKDAIFIQDRNWRQKIIVKHVPGRRLYRIFIYTLAIIIIPYLYKYMKEILTSLRNKLLTYKLER